MDNKSFNSCCDLGHNLNERIKIMDIKFRGKRLDNRAWVVGEKITCGVSGKVYIVPEDSGINESEKIGEEGCLNIFAFEVIPETVGQYIGYKDDIKKIEIYIDDVVKITYSTQTGECSRCVRVADITDYRLMAMLDHCNEVEVIGNIYDNLDLMKGEM